MSKTIKPRASFLMRQTTRDAMTMLTHPYFGELNFNDLCFWESNITLSHITDNPIELLLWVADESLKPTAEFLDKSAIHFQNINNLHQKATSELINYLTADGEFMEHYTNAIDDYDLPQLAALIDDNKLTADTFVKLLKLQTIASWYDEDGQIIMDYMIDPEQSDQILAVMFGLDGRFIDISWES